MENYFFYTPIYKIWMDVISILSPKSTFIINDLRLAFIEIKCSREGVIDVYSNDSQKLQLEFLQEYRYFVCSLFDLNSGKKVQWKNKAPEPKKIIDLEELEEQIDLWLTFLKNELS